MTILAEEVIRRCTFAVITCLDAGKSIFTEAPALHAHVISKAGTVHDKADRKLTVPGWVGMEKDRDTPTTSSTPQLECQPEGHDGEPYMINLVDTSGHAGFSEDIYHMLTVADAAVMLVDGAKGFEPQMLKLFRVRKSNGISIVTVASE